MQKKIVFSILILFSFCSIMIYSCKSPVVEPPQITTPPEQEPEPEKPVPENPIKITRVEFDANGGSFSDGTELITLPYESGGEIKFPANPHRTNYKFERWDIIVPDENSDKKDTLKYVARWGDLYQGFSFVEGGKMMMNGTEVTISSFFMGKYEVTQDKWKSVTGRNPSYFSLDANNGFEVHEGEDGYKRPVESIMWIEAVMFCNRLSIKEGLTPCYSLNGITDPDKWYTKAYNDWPINSSTGIPEEIVVEEDMDKEEKRLVISKIDFGVTWCLAYITEYPENVNNSTGILNFHYDFIEELQCDFEADGYRLPTSAEWEYAARGGKLSQGFKYSGSDNLDEVAWYQASKDMASFGTHEVGLKKPNELDLYDMNGNVIEYCWDLYNPTEKFPFEEINPKGCPVPDSITDDIVKYYKLSHVCRGGDVMRYFQLTEEERNDHTTFEVAYSNDKPYTILGEYSTNEYVGLRLVRGASK